ncbi:HAD family hydrolase [Ktedonobacter racemifer]|uniref:HAD-superfamily hydrolase, subfamily IA, variant 2 (HAD-like) n=1 Tax=Ktedonobacter racemifer DSM 44963 TaxID=485913 RepID=D6U5W7_KTERA|nr:HAD-IA family hydrolase [Ktedonobacter racemifer]EFH80378.1 HAD-superfamily hydrolase, subfamily IA, variant 2 (HAD-like) [Ktedonobacter racemifer DSM 44963]
MVEQARTNLPYDAIIFDLFGTLVDDLLTEPFTQTLEEMASFVGAPRDIFLQMWMHDTWPLRAAGHLPDVEANILYICTELGITPKPEQIQHAVRRRLELTRQSLKPRHDALETLETLRAAGYKLGLISDCSSEVPLIWRTTPLAALIDVPIFSCSVKLKKPDPRIYHLAYERLGIAPERGLFIANGESNELAGAQAIGMEAVLIRVPYSEEHNPRCHEARTWRGARIESIKGLLAYLDGVRVEEL